jgi:hypothetical protein
MLFAFLENGKMRNMKIALVIAFSKYKCEMRDFYFCKKIKSLEGDVQICIIMHYDLGHRFYGWELWQFHSRVWGTKWIALLALAST